MSKFHFSSPYQHHHFILSPTSSAMNLESSNNTSKTTVVNVKTVKGEFVYIGRKVRNGLWGCPQSKWHNPFHLRDHGNDRDLVLKRYRDYILREPELLASLHELKGKQLACWCKPKACHGDVLVELIEEQERATEELLSNSVKLLCRME